MLETTVKTGVPRESGPSDKGRRIRYFVVGVAALAIVIAKLHFSDPVVPDDAFITLRYSYNLLHHGVFTYNFPSASARDAATSPLYAVFLAPLLAIFSPVRAFDIVMALSLAGAAVLLFTILEEEWSRTAAVAGTIALLLNDYLYATRGMETSLFILMCLLTIRLFAKVVRNATSPDEKPRKALAVGTGIVWALAVFIRGEAILIGLFLVIKVINIANQRPSTAPKSPAHGGRGRSRFVRLYAKRAFPNPRAALSVISSLAIGCFIVSLPFIIWLESQTGSLIPLTLKAKQEQAKSSFWGTGWIYYKGLVAFVNVYPWDKEIYALILLAAAGLAYFVVKKAKLSRYMQTTTIVGFGILQLIAYGNLLVVPFYHWYFGPQLVAVSALVGIIVGWAVKHFRKGPLNALASAAVMVVFSYMVFSSATLGRGAPTMLYTRQTSYEAAAQWLKINTPAKATVAATEIGYIGYYSHRQMIDYLGLLSNRTAKWTEQANFYNWLFYYKPDYWVVHNPFWSFEEAVQLPWFHTVYSKVASFPGLIIYKKTGVIPSISGSEALFAKLSTVPGTPRG